MEATMVLAGGRAALGSRPPPPACDVDPPASALESRRPASQVPLPPLAPSGGRGIPTPATVRTPSAKFAPLALLP